MRNWNSEHQDKSMTKADFLPPVWWPPWWILLTFRIKSKHVTKSFKVLHDLAPVSFSNNKTCQSSPQIPHSAILICFQSLNMPCFLLPLGMRSCCCVPRTPLNIPSLPTPMTWLILTGPSNQNLGITSSRKLPLTSKLLLGDPLLDPVAHHSVVQIAL